MSPPCRHCGSPLTLDFLDLGFAPPSNGYLTADDLSKPETTYPLRLKTCQRCWLVQTEDYPAADKLFTDSYAYFSSTSKTWLDHAARFSESAIEFLDLNSSSFVIEVGSNDGYLLRNFLAKGIPCLGIEPTASTAQAARELGIDVLGEFFGTGVAESLEKADLVYAANVFAHVPDINDFTHAIALALKPRGIAVLEFHHLLRMVEFVQFDSAYHEHYSYLSLLAAGKILSSAGLRVFDVEELDTHGGSLRVFACLEQTRREVHESVSSVLFHERLNGLDTAEYYAAFQRSAVATKNSGLQFLLDAKATGRRVAAYGAAAKGNTFLNFAGIKPDLLPFVCDAAKSKIGKFLPGSRIPILSPDVLNDERPDDLIILPWNIAPEIKRQLSYLGNHGTRFWRFVPSVEEVQ